MTDRALAVETPSETGTRAQLARLVGEHGPITVADLAAHLQRTPTAVRRHLEQMLADGLVEARDVAGPRGRGRPAKGYVLTSTAHADLPSGYDDLATEALAYLAEQAGPAAVTAFARRRSAELAERLAPTVDAAGPDPADRADALAVALRAEGYAATIRPLTARGAAQAVQLCQGHCPVQNVARRFPELCEAETDALAALIGVDVRRLATLAAGDHVCTTHIPVTPRTTAAHPPRKALR